MEWIANEGFLSRPLLQHGGEVAAQFGAQIAAFLDDHGGQAKRSDGCADFGETTGRHGEAGERVAHKGIEAEGKDHSIRAPLREFFQGLVEGFQEIRIAGAARQRQVEVGPLAVFHPGLGGIAPEERIKPFGMGMDRHGQHIIAVVKDALGAIAVMQVNVQNRRSAARGAQAFGGDGGIVQVTKTTGKVAERTRSGRMVQKRPVPAVRPLASG